jgi:molybdate transport system substrate-binding protein
MSAPVRLATLLFAALAQSTAWADEAQVAVAANFAEPMKALATLLERTTGHTLKMATGASGAFYSQIRNGAPFDVFLSADNQRPERLEQDGLAQPGTRFTYAIGKLVLWSAKAGRVDDQGAVLRAADLGKVALANPKTAPYGAAAMQVIQQLGLSAAFKPKLVQGESIGQTFGFVSTGNADVGFVAMSQVLADGQLRGGSMWVIPKALYEPIRQDAVLLKRGAGNEAAQALLKLLKSSDGQAVIRAAGYDL